MNNPTPTECLRARTVLALTYRLDSIEETRRQIAALASRPDVKPQALVGDLIPYVQRVARDAEAAKELRAVLEGLDLIIATEAPA